MPSGCCPCSCPHCGLSSSYPWPRSLKRKLDQADGAVPSLQPAVLARVEVENEVAALREAVASQQETIQDLCAELEEERSAAASAASETMSMILRLQREKAEVQMEARQFKRFAEEKMAHDQGEIAALEDLLFRKDQALQSLSYEVQAYKHRLLSLGVSPNDPFADPDVPDSPPGDYDYGYPPLRCTVPANVDPEEECVDLEKCTFGETPRALERRIYELEKMPGSSGVMEKEVVDQPSSQHCSSALDGCSAVGSETSSVFAHENGVQGGKKAEEPPDDVPESDDASDRVYTIDAVHLPVGGGAELDYGATLKGVGKGGAREEEADIKKLCTRLQALESDRESMRQALISMRTEKAQLVLLREIAQQLCKEAVLERRVVKKQQPLMKNFSFASVIKWVVSIVFWRKKAARTKYPFAPSNNNVGLLLLLDKSPLMKQWTAIRMQR